MFREESVGQWGAYWGICTPMTVMRSQKRSLLFSSFIQIYYWDFDCIELIMRINRFEETGRGHQVPI